MKAHVYAERFEALCVVPEEASDEVVAAKTREALLWLMQSLWSEMHKNIKSRRAQSVGALLGVAREMNLKYKAVRRKVKSVDLNPTLFESLFTAQLGISLEADIKSNIAKSKGLVNSQGMLYSEVPESVNLEGTDEEGSH